MMYLIAAVLWPLVFVGVYFLYPVLFPDKPAPDVAILFLTALMGMAALTFAGALRLLGFLRDDRTRREKSRHDAESDHTAP